MTEDEIAALCGGRKISSEIEQLRLQCFQWEITVNQKDAEIKRLRIALVQQTKQHEYPCSPHCAGYLREQVAQAEIKRLREALLAAKDHIGNGYQPPELIKQIDSALKQSE